MATRTAVIPEAYRQSIWGSMDRPLRNSFTGSSILGVLLLLAIFIVPKPPDVPVTLEKIPERFAKLILEKPKPPAPSPKAAQQVAVADTPPVEAPPKVATSKPTPPKPKAKKKGRKKT